MTLEENKAIAARFYEVYNHGNMGLIDELFSPHFVGRDPNDPSQVRHGPEGVKLVVEAFRNAFLRAPLRIRPQKTTRWSTVTRGGAPIEVSFWASLPPAGR